MNISTLKKILANAEQVNFQLANGSMVPAHFHVTEVGIVTRDFIDCGGTLRHERVANFQLWNADDHDHRLKAGKLLGIIARSEKVLGMEDLDIEVEYQSGTIGRYDLEFDAPHFRLIPKHTACLAMDKCGLPPAERSPDQTVPAPSGQNCCTPGGGCC